MKLHVSYMSGGAFTIEAGTEEELMYLYNLAQKTLWGNNHKPLSLDDMDKWLGWA